MEKLTVEHTIWINAPRERVWEAITDGQQISHWWGDHWEIPQVEAGATIRFGSENDPNLAKEEDWMVATLAVVDRPREFAIQWPPQPQYHSVAMFTRFVLQEENDGTRVTVSETGFEALPDDIRQKQYEGTAAGYATVMASLKDYLEEN